MENQTEDTQKDKSKKVRLGTVIQTLLIILAVYFIGIGFLLYFTPLSEEIKGINFVKKTLEIVPYPAAMVGGSMISVKDLGAQVKSVRTFYESQDFSEMGMRVDFSTQDGKKRLQIKERQILSKMIEDRVIELEAKKRGIILADDIIDQEVDRKLNEYGTADQLKENLEKLYGWKLEDFKKNIVKPDLYAEKLSADIREKNPAFSDARKKIEEAEKELANRVSFADVAKKYSEGESAKDGGDLGWFGAGEMIPEVAVEVFAMEKGQTSKVIESSLGFHIIKLEDKKVEEEEEKVKVSQIFVGTQPFFQWILEAQKKYAISVPIYEFRWNSQSGEVDFNSESMRSYEEELINNPINDPSVIF